MRSKLLSLTIPAGTAPGATFSGTTDFAIAGAFLSWSDRTVAGFARGSEGVGHGIWTPADNVGGGAGGYAGFFRESDAADTTTGRQVSLNGPSVGLIDAAMVDQGQAQGSVTWDGAVGTFTLTATTAFTVDVVVNVLVLGGVTCIRSHFRLDSSTVTVGGHPGTPDLVYLVASTNTISHGTAGDAHVTLGVASRTGGVVQGALHTGSEVGRATSAALQWSGLGSIYAATAHVFHNDTSITKKAVLSFTESGFALGVSGLPSKRAFAMAVIGCDARVLVGQTIEQTGVDIPVTAGFRPAGGLVISHVSGLHYDDNIQPDLSLSSGMFASSAEQRVIGAHSDSGQAVSVASSFRNEDAVLLHGAYESAALVVRESMRVAGRTPTGVNFRMVTTPPTGETREFLTLLFGPDTAGVDLPAADTSVAASAVGSTRVDVTWVDQATDETSRWVHRKAGLGASDPVDESTRVSPDLGANVTAWQDEGASPGATYTYFTEVMNPGGSRYSAGADVTTPAGPSVPTITSPKIMRTVAGTVIRLAATADNATQLRWYRGDPELGGTLLGDNPVDYNTADRPDGTEQLYALASTATDSAKSSTPIEIGPPLTGGGGTSTTTIIRQDAMLTELTEYGLAAVVEIPLLNSGGDLVQPVLAEGDVMISKDGGAPVVIAADEATLPYVNGMLQVPLTAAELDARTVSLRLVAASDPGAFLPQLVKVYTTYHPAAAFPHGVAAVGTSPGATAGTDQVPITVQAGTVRVGQELHFTGGAVLKVRSIPTAGTVRGEAPLNATVAAGERFKAYQAGANPAGPANFASLFIDPDTGFVRSDPAHLSVALFAEGEPMADLAESVSQVGVQVGEVGVQVSGVGVQVSEVLAQPAPDNASIATAATDAAAARTAAEAVSIRLTSARAEKLDTVMQAGEVSLTAAEHLAILGNVQTGIAAYDPPTHAEMTAALGTLAKPGDAMALTAGARAALTSAILAFEVLPGVTVQDLWTGRVDFERDPATETYRIRSADEATLIVQGSAEVDETTGLLTRLNPL